MRTFFENPISFIKNCFEIVVNGPLPMMDNGLPSKLSNPKNQNVKLKNKYEGNLGLVYSTIRCNMLIYLTRN